LFELGLMQTDPNFANYRYDPQSQQLILLDFGATRSFTPALGQAYKDLMSATMAADHQSMAQAGIAIGYFDGQTQPKHLAAVLSLFEMALEPLCFDGAFDFGTTDMAPRLREAGLALGLERDFWHIPPIDTLFLHRKLGGLFLLATRLKARIDVRQLAWPHLPAARAVAE
jgi:hypothetical protein